MPGLARPPATAQDLRVGRFRITPKTASDLRLYQLSFRVSVRGISTNTQDVTQHFSACAWSRLLQPPGGDGVDDTDQAT